MSSTQPNHKPDKTFSELVVVTVSCVRDLILGTIEKLFSLPIVVRALSEAETFVATRSLVESPGFTDGESGATRQNLPLAQHGYCVAAEQYGISELNQNRSHVVELNSVATKFIEQLH